MAYKISLNIIGYFKYDVKTKKKRNIRVAVAFTPVHFVCLAMSYRRRLLEKQSLTVDYTPMPRWYLDRVYHVSIIRQKGSTLIGVLRYPVRFCPSRTNSGTEFPTFRKLANTFHIK